MCVCVCVCVCVFVCLCESAFIYIFCGNIFLIGIKVTVIYIYSNNTLFDHLSTGDVLTFSRYTEYVVIVTAILIKKTSRQKQATQTLELLNIPIKDLVWLSTTSSGTRGVSVTEKEITHIRDASRGL